MIDDTVRQVFVHMLLLTEIFRYVMNLAKVSHGMDRWWVSNWINLNKELFHKIILHNKIRYLHMTLLNSCSIIDVHAYPEREQNNFYNSKKTEIHRKWYKDFSTTFHIQSDLNLSQKLSVG